MARTLGAHQSSSTSRVLAQEIEFPIPENQLQTIKADPEKPELFFCRDMQGYGWCFRKQGYLNVGLGRVDPKNLATHVNSFCQDLKARGVIPQDSPSRFLGHAYHLYENNRSPLCGAGVLLLGDAAGLAYALSGEGIRPAVESGLMAAETILAAEGDYCEQNLGNYVDQLRRRFDEPALPSWAGAMPAAWLAFLAAKLMTSRWFSRNVVMDRWFLRSQQKPLNQSS